MAKKMLIDAAHPEETRVVVVSGKKVEEFDFETAHRKPLKGNIYLAKVTRVEPSLQAAFVEYGGNRHGFLAFSEIHPDYYQIPVADRQALIDAQAEEDRLAAERAAAEDDEAEAAEAAAAEETTDDAPDAESADADEDDADMSADEIVLAGQDDPDDADTDAGAEDGEADDDAEPSGGSGALTLAAFLENDDDNLLQGPLIEGEAEEVSASDDGESEEDTLLDPAIGEDTDLLPEGPLLTESEEDSSEDTSGDAGSEGERRRRGRGRGRGRSRGRGRARRAAPSDDVEQVGGEDALEELPHRSLASMRRYRIQEVIKRRQILLVQVVKEERGNKGAALTTYLSLAGRYCVLMPNTARGGGISRKITNASDRKRLRKIAEDLDVAPGTGLIVRTAGANRTKAEIKRDFEYLLRMWETIRELTLKSSAPTLIYEEGSLIKRAIRDLYNKDIDTVLVEGDEAYKDAKAFMRMLMPSHAKNVQPYKDRAPLFQRFQIESQLDTMFQPTVTLPSGGYIVLNPTEALVSIDVNSGKSTREHSIEETALRTNLEAATEVARQLRLRDLAGLVVIDFIDMDEGRHNRAVEKKLKECLKSDRARLQLGRISAFGLLEMSRQRLRPSVLEGSSEICPHCEGTGYVRSIESTALRILRSCEEEALRGRYADVTVAAAMDAAVYVLNRKRQRLQEIEDRYGLTVMVKADPTALAGTFSIELGAPMSPEKLRAIESNVVSHESVFEAASDLDPVSGEEIDQAEPEDAAIEAIEADSDDDEDRSRRRKRRRRRRKDEGDAQDASAEDAASSEETEGAEAVASEDGEEAEKEGGERRRRRRGRRGGRRARRAREAAAEAEGNGSEDAPSGEAQPAEAAPEEDLAAIDTTPMLDTDETGDAPAPSPFFGDDDEIDTTPQPFPKKEAIEIVEETAAPAPESANGNGANGRREADASNEIEDEAETAEASDNPASAPPPGEAKRGWWNRKIFG